MHSGNLKETFCQLCLNIINDRSYQLTEQDIREVLKILLPTLNLEETAEHFMCEECSIKLHAAFNFKLTCMDTEDVIFSHINASKMSVVDLEEVYLKEKGNIQLAEILENQRICRLCIHLITYGFASLNEIDIDIIGIYIPQVNLNLTNNPVICGPCFDSLYMHGDFLKKCLDAQEKYKSTDKKCNIKTEETEIKLEAGSQDEQEKFKSIDKPFYVKSEEIEIKVEEDDSNSSYNLDDGRIENKKRHISEDIEEIKKEYKCETGFNDNCTMSMLVHNVQIPKSHMSRLQQPEFSLDTQLYHDYKFKQNLEEHMSVQKSVLEVGKYKCDTCSFETKRNENLKRHQLLHKDPLEIEMYNCDMCSFETRHKGCLKTHQLIHEASSQIQMYKCDTCTYKTKYNSNLHKHQLIHKDSTEIQMYTCDTCSFKTKYKCALNKHLVTHKDPSEMQMYKCDMCSYETKLKGHLKAHQLVHKNSTEVRVYKCDTCSFETRYKGSLKTHQLTHKNSPKIRMYKCHLCSFQSRYKNCLNAHLYLHMKSSETQMYKCDSCIYETKEKNDLNAHKLMHKDSSEMQMYNSDSCTYETEHQHHLKRDQVIHKDPSEIQVYKCEL